MGIIKDSLIKIGMFTLIMLASLFTVHILSVWSAGDTHLYTYCINTYGDIDSCIRAELYPQTNQTILMSKNLIITGNASIDSITSLGIVDTSTLAANTILTKSLLMNITINYTARFSNITQLSVKELNRNYILITDSKGQIVGRLNLEPRIADLEGFAYWVNFENNRIKTCLKNSGSYATYQTCVTK